MMTVNLELSPALADRLLAEAALLGTTAETIIREAVEARFLPTDGEPSSVYDPRDVNSRRPVTRDEKLQEFEEFLRLTEELPPANIPDEMLRRENMYEDRHV